MLEDRQERIQARMDALWNEIQWRKMRSQLQEEMRMHDWKIIIESQWDTQECEFRGTFMEAIGFVVGIAEPDNITKLTLKFGDDDA